MISMEDIRYMKRFLTKSLLLISFMFLALQFVLTAQAYVPTNQVLSGQSRGIAAQDVPFAYTVSLQDAEQVVGFQWKFTYDARLFRLDALIEEAGFAGKLVYNLGVSGEIAVNYSDPTIPIAGNATVFTLWFTPIAESYDGWYAVLSPDPGYHNLMTYLGEGYEIIESSSIEYAFAPISSGLIGDVSMNGEITIKDVALIQLHLAALSMLTPSQLVLADVNFDGKVTILDASLIQLYLAGLLAGFDLPSRYELRFETNGGDLIPSRWFLPGVALNDLPTPAKSAATFLGWYLDAEFLYPFDLTVMPDHNLVVYAKWESISDIPDILTNEPISITLWHGYGSIHNTFLEQMAVQFKELYPNITVLIQQRGGFDNLRTFYTQAIAADALPNLIVSYPSHLHEFIPYEAIRSLDSYADHPTWGLFGNHDINDIVDVYYAEATDFDLERTLWSMPFAKSTEVVAYNKTLFDELGLSFPATWEGLMAIAPLLNDALMAKAEIDVRQANPSLLEAELNLLIEAAKAMVRPIIYDLLPNYYATLTHQLGGTLASSTYDRHVGITTFLENKGAILAANEMFLNRSLLTSAHYANLDYSSLLFLNQRTAVTLISTSGVRYNTPQIDPFTGNPTFELAIAPMPYFEGLEHFKGSLSQGTQIAMSETGTDQEKLASWLFLRYLTSTDVTAKMGVETGYLPIRYSAIQSGLYQDYLINPPAAKASSAAAAAVALADLDTQFYEPHFMFSGELLSILGEAVYDILYLSNDVGAALDSAYLQFSLFLQGPQEPLPYHQVGSIAEVFSYPENSYVELQSVTVLEMTSEGVLLGDESGTIYVYGPSLLTSKIRIGSVVRFRGVLSNYFGQFQLIGKPIENKPLIHLESARAPISLEPTVVEDLSAYFAQLHENLQAGQSIGYDLIRLTAKVCIADPISNYGYMLVDPDVDCSSILIAVGGPLTTNAVLVYYKSDAATLVPLHGQTITIDVFLHSYRYDRNVFTVLYFESSPIIPN